MNTLKLAEKPFFSIQGSGIHIGRPSLFIRFQGCSLNPPCPFCDTGYAYDIEKKDGVFYIPQWKLDHKIINYDFINHIVFTGGEPMLFQNHIETTIQNNLRKNTYDIETNGQIEAKDELLHEHRVTFVISPKFHYHYKVELLDQIQNYNQNNAQMAEMIVKFVYTNDSINDIQETVDSYNIDHKRVYVMPECTTRKEHLERQGDVIEFCKKNGYNFSPRLHILEWNNSRGV